MSTTTFTALFPFGGLGAGARGFLDAQVQLLGQTARFRILGGIAANTWPQRWDGSEPGAEKPFDAMFADGTVQPRLPMFSEDDS